MKFDYFKLIFFSCLISTYLTDDSVVQYCETPAASPESAPQPPELPDRFETRIEINVDGKVATDLIQYFDFNKRKAAVIIETLNIRKKLIFDYPTNEIHVIEEFANKTNDEPFLPGEVDQNPTVCNSVSLTGTPSLNFYFGASNKENDTFIVPNSAYDVLHFRDFPQAYNGTETIRGIPCDVYMSCQYSSEKQSNYTVKYYFSKSNYSLPYLNAKYPRVPVRALFKGVKLVNGALVDFEEYHDFHQFKANYVNYDIFQTPPGLYCTGRKMTKKLPQMNNYKQFTFSQEETANGVTKYLTDFVYDLNYPAVKFQIRNSELEESTFWVKDPLIAVHDYNIGVSFTYNKNLKNCSITPISSSAIDEDSNYTSSLFNTDGSYVIKLKSPESLFSLDSNYVYTGQRKVANIPAEIYISDRTTFYDKPIITEFAFTSSSFEMDTIIGPEKNIPLGISVQTPGFNSYSTFYNFDSSVEDIREFDVTRCFQDDNQRIDFRLVYPYKDIVTAENIGVLQTALRTESLITMLAATNESFTRFRLDSVLSISEDGNFYIRSSIFDKPGNLNYFTKVTGHWILSPNSVLKKKIFSVILCAGLCIEDTECLSFDYSSNLKWCYLNMEHASQVDLTESSYDHYSRNTLTGFYARPKFEVWQLLKTAVSEKRLKLSVPILTNTSAFERAELVATKIEEISDSDYKQGTTAILSKYDKKVVNKRFAGSKDRVILKTNLDDCAKACTDELKFDCLAFDFCYVSGDCKLSRQYLTNNVSEFIDSGDCDVYERDPLFHYTEFPSKATINQKDKKYKVMNAGECASKCDSETSLHCRSFNFCPESSSCFLSENHLIDGSEQSTTDLICTHYSRNYLSDFIYTSTATITLDAEVIYSDSSLEKCSKSCVTSDGFLCKSFDYCEETKKCLLNSGMKAISNKNSTSKDSCANYKREYFFVTSTNAAAAEKDKSIQILTALSVVFSLVGLGFGLIGTYYYLKKKNFF